MLSTEPAARDAARWIALAVAGLAISGALAVVLVLGRIPAVAGRLFDDPELPRRSLVVHVNLAMGVWFFAFLAGLFGLLPGARRVRTAPLGVGLATLGLIAFTAPTFFPEATPVLSNYVPVLDDALFLAGLGAFALGITLGFVDPRLWSRGAEPAELPRESRHGLRAAAATYLIAMITFAAAYLTRDPDAALLPYYERLFWGGGHVLQTAASMAMLAVWLFLLHRLTGRNAVPPRLAGALFVSMLLPTVLGPWLAQAEHPHRGFTGMMELGIFPAVLVVIGAGIAALGRSRGAARTPAFVGLATSMVMTLIGFGFGAAITADTTLTPAHYHINIGAVTVSFMTALFELLPRLGLPLARPRLATWQPLIYGLGQTVFAAGLGIAGFWGNAARKVYGAEQQLSAPVERSGLVLAGIGGAFALVGGVMFAVILLRSWQLRGSVVDKGIAR